MAGDDNVLRRLEAVEAQLAIRDLAARYAVAVDARNLEGVVSLFVDDVNAGRFGVGRDALRAFFAQSLSRFYRSMHHLGGQTVEIIDSDHASGRVYCRAEHEVGTEWVVVLMCYFDDYERRDGVWLFARRRPSLWLASDWLRRPTGPQYVDWEGQRDAALPGRLSTWREFWDSAGQDVEHDVTSFPV